MMDERARVIRDLLVRLNEVGINPDRPFDAVFVPGLGWRFEQDGQRELVDDASPGASSSSAGGVSETSTVRRPTPR